MGYLVIFSKNVASNFSGPHRLLPCDFLLYRSFQGHHPMFRAQVIDHPHLVGSPQKELMACISVC